MIIIIAISLSVGVFIVARLRRSRPGGTADLGTMSEQWLAENRQSHS